MSSHQGKPGGCFIFSYFSEIYSIFRILGIDNCTQEYYYIAMNHTKHRKEGKTMKIQEMSKNTTVIEGLTEEQVTNYIEAYVPYDRVFKGSYFTKYSLNGILLAEKLWNAGTYTLALY